MFSFCDTFVATFNQSSNLAADDEQSQSTNDFSAMYTVWNLIADLIEINDQKRDQQQQITDFYGKIKTTIPRIACLMQLYFNAMEILNEVRETVSYAEGDNNDLIINESFVTNVQHLIRSKYYVYDMTYLPRDTIDQTTIDPMIIVQKDAVLAAWKWYEHHLDVITTLFTIDYSFSVRPVTSHSSILPPQRTLKQMIMLFDFNIFPVSALTDKHPISGQTCVHRS
jgi:hypothetical protein